MGFKMEDMLIDRDFVVVGDGKKEGESELNQLRAHVFWIFLPSLLSVPSCPPTTTVESFNGRSLSFPYPGGVYRYARTRPTAEMGETR